MAAAFNNFFVNVSQKINQDIPRTRKSPLDYMPNANYKSFFVSPVTPEEIEIIIGSLKMVNHVVHTAYQQNYWKFWVLILLYPFQLLLMNHLLKVYSQTN